MKKNSKLNIKESPDGAILKSKHLSYFDRDAYAFGYDFYGDFIVADGGGRSHVTYDINSSEESSVPGRLWEDSKVISFWFYPDLNTFKDIIENLKNEGFDINDTWKVEIPMVNQNIKSDDAWLKADNISSYYIKISEYDNNIIKNPKKYKNIIDKQIQKHQMSPTTKNDIVPTGIGSKKRTAGLTPTQKHQMKSTSEAILSVDTIVENLIVRRTFGSLTEYAKSAIRDIFLQMPTRSVYKKYWHSFMEQVSSHFGKNNTNKAWKQLKNEQFIYEDDSRYHWRKSYGPVNSPAPPKPHTKLNEWADDITVNDKTLEYYHNAIPFGIPYTKMPNEKIENIRLGAKNKTHHFCGLNNSAKYSGRIWIGDKIISFWAYPESLSELKQIVEKLNSVSDGKFKIDSSWKIDMPYSKKNKIDKLNIFRYNLNDYTQDSILIPIFDYDPNLILNNKNLLNFINKKRDLHTMTPIEKNKIKRDIPAGVGSKKTIDGQPYSKYYQMSTSSENINENKKFDYGCLMLQLNVKGWDKFITSFIDEEDVYNISDPAYGYETEPHITVLFGFENDTDYNKVQEYTKHTVQNSNVGVILSNISHFETPEFDVVKFDIESPLLKKLNKVMRMNFNYTNAHPNYNPHCTIAYVKKGMGKKYDKKIEKIRTSSRNFKISYPPDNEEYFKI